MKYADAIIKRHDTIMPTEGPDNRYRAPALDKGLDILELLAAHLDGLTRAEIVRELGRKPSEIYRMLERLVARQYVVRSANGSHYSLSLKLFALGMHHPPVSRLIDQATPVMEQFAREAEQSCHLSMYDRGNLRVVAHVPGPGAWGFVVRLGAEVSLIDTCSGSVMLAFQSTSARTRMLAAHRRLQGELALSDEELATTWKRIRQQGFERVGSRQGFGVTDVCYPLLGPHGRALAVLATPFIRRIDRHTGPSLEQVQSLLADAAASLSLHADDHTAVRA